MRMTREQAEQQRELNRRLHVLVEAAQCLQTRAAMLEQLEQHYAAFGPTVEADPVAFETADRTRRVAAFLASKALRDLIKDNEEVADLLLGVPGASVSGVDFMEPRLPKQRTTGRSVLEKLGFNACPCVCARARGQSGRVAGPAAGMAGGGAQGPWRRLAMTFYTPI
jgi:hypothetical protein